MKRSIARSYYFAAQFVHGDGRACIAFLMPVRFAVSGSASIRRPPLLHFCFNLYFHGPNDPESDNG